MTEPIELEDGLTDDEDRTEDAVEASRQQRAMILGAMTHVTSIIEGENGYVVVQGCASDDQPTITVFDDEREGLVKLLTFIGEYFGEPYDRYGKENINITFDRKGNKAE